MLEKDEPRVLMMSGATYESVTNDIVKKALKDDNPLSYIDFFEGIEIVIDEELPFMHVEVYERWMYEEVMKYGKLDY